MNDNEEQQVLKKNKTTPTKESDRSTFQRTDTTGGYKQSHLPHVAPLDRYSVNFAR